MKVLKLLLLFAMGASLSLAGCDDDYLYPVEYPVYDPDGGSDNGGGDEIPVPEKVNNKVVAHRGGSAEAGTAKYPDNSIASLSYAISLGCYASECDIYWTADNNVVVAHAANGCYVNNLKPWEHTLDELRAAGKLSNGELLPTLEEFIDVALHAGTTRLWLDVKRIEVGGATSNTAESVKACSPEILLFPVPDSAYGSACKHDLQKHPAFLRVHRFGQCRDLGGMLFRGPAGRHRGRLDELLGAFGL